MSSSFAVSVVKGLRIISTGMSCHTARHSVSVDSSSLPTRGWRYPHGTARPKDVAFHVPAQEKTSARAAGSLVLTISSSGAGPGYSPACGSTPSSTWQLHLYHLGQRRRCHDRTACRSCEWCKKLEFPHHVDVERVRTDLFEILAPVLLFSKLNKLFFGYFRPEKISLDNESK